ncbi:carbohydrate ABC transporter permease [Allofournierella sp.]|uniref:carbohydrate ABC transporter permease n=1 Tax=Allofournierella sp. TaxID=1940256 RepID=UPI003AB16260
MRKKPNEQYVWGIAFFAPFLVGFGVFYLLPFGMSVVYTFLQNREFVFLQNYAGVFAREAFRLALANTLRFLAVCLPLIMVLALLLAMLIHGVCKKNVIFQSVFLFPLVVPVAATVIILKMFLNDNGIVNGMLTLLGGQGKPWLHSQWSFWVLVGLYLWKNVGYNVVLLLAGLNSIPPECIEAAKIDGASAWKTFTHITFPLLLPTMFFVLVVSIANSFKSFREAYLLGGDTPNTSIYMLQHFLNNNFQNANYARLSVAAISLFVVVGTIITLLWNYMRRDAT